MNHADIACGKTRNYKGDSALKKEVQGAILWMEGQGRLLRGSDL